MLKCLQNLSVRFLVQFFSKQSPLVVLGKAIIKKSKQLNFNKQLKYLQV